MPIKGEIEFPGDKSISHRSLIMGAMSVGHTEIHNLLESKDILNTVSILRKLGVKIKKKQNSWVVSGVGTCGFKQPNQVLNAGNSGTLARLILGMLVKSNSKVNLIGDKSLSKRDFSRV